MSNDDTLKALGKIIPEGEEFGRDAVHIAVIPILAERRMAPGDDYKGIGVVDPFLQTRVEKGERFWLFLTPGSITSLRHEWTHPAFPQESRTFIPAGASEAERWIAEYCARIGCRVDELMRHADYWVETADNKFGGEYWVDGGRWEGEYVDPEFWKHYQAVRGVEVPESKQQNFFSCSC